MGQKVVPIRPHFHGEAHTSEGTKVHTNGGTYPGPDLTISWSLHGKEARQGMGLKVDNGEGSHSDLVSSASLGDPYPRKPHFLPPKLYWRDLLNCLL